LLPWKTIKHVPRKNVETQLQLPLKFSKPEYQGMIFLRNVGTFNHHMVQSPRAGHHLITTAMKNLKNYNVNNHKGKGVYRISGSDAILGETPHLLYFAFLTEGYSCARILLMDYLLVEKLTLCVTRNCLRFTISDKGRNVLSFYS
jgi:hypothetical protein